MASSKRLEAENAVLAFIESWDAPFGISFRDIQEATDIPLGTVHAIVRCLADEGRIQHTEGISRSIRAI